MSNSEPLQYLRLRWPDDEVPQDNPIWMHYEVDRTSDSVLRMVEVFADGRVTRNSVEIEQRGGADCPSLFDISVSDAFDGMEVEAISCENFDELWERGVDTPFWNVS